MSFIKTKKEVERIQRSEFTLFGAKLGFVYWLTNMDIVKKLLPPPLEPINEPLVLAYIADFPKISFGLPYKEGAIFLACHYQNITGLYCPSMIVTHDIAMAGGREFFGFPKKIADINMSIEESFIRGSINRRGIDFFSLEIDLTDDSNDEKAGEILMSLRANPAGTPYYNFMYQHCPGTGKIKEPVNLVEFYLGSENEESFDYGSGDVKFQHSIFDPWYEVEVEKMLGSFYVVHDTIMRSGKILTEVDVESYAPYAYKMWDPLPDE
ncbi:MAG: acetoacetate decarboxylase family protein [Candidatus Hodarchaeales archaeon]|jgi:acetoacetate decarboxylase